jgi:hypothetical protein
MVKKYKKNKGGYAMLFTVVVVSAISVITAGLTNIAYKQITLSSLAKDSQTATIWADTANECSVFFEQVAIKHLLGQEPPKKEWTCGGIKFNIVWEEPQDLDLGGYKEGNYEYSLVPKGNTDPKKPCFEFSVKSIKEEGAPTKSVTIESSGFNICDKDNIRTVERAYEINYSEKYDPTSESSESSGAAS